VDEPTTALEPIDNAPERRFEVTVDGVRAELLYRRRDGRMVLLHTEVPSSLEGRGIGGTLVRAAVDTASREDLTLVPRCPFARSWLERHPGEAARVRIDWPGPPDRAGS
jgi:predicted GNAT family acetyltransferase